jgi:hypothetical protein
MKDRKVIARNANFLIQPDLPLVDQVQNCQCHPCFGYALLRKKLVHAFAGYPLASIDTHNGNARATRENAPLVVQQIF